MIFDPGMIQSHVIGNEIQEQPQAALAEPFAQPRQRGIAAQTAVRRVTGDRKAGAGDILFAQVRQRLLKFPAPLEIGPGDPLGCRARLPDTQEPDPVKADSCQAIQLGIRNVIECGAPAQLLRQFRQPDTGIDLIERRKTRCCH